ncbi:hypothetical protein GGF37_002246 [Kickxella alabastrina]|nr:hypothetical protein GGF37_002246 [Kickxella alabastrina]
MLTHRKNWCRVCGSCLTCPRTNRSQFQQGGCHCEERQVNHVSPKKAKGEQLFSFRYRHLSAEDLDILNELRPRFKFPTPPIERNLVRANICSTCQQRLRRARISRRRLAAVKCYTTSSGNALLYDGSSDSAHSDAALYSTLCLDNLAIAQPQLSAVRSTLQACAYRPCENIGDLHRPGMLHPPGSVATLAGGGAHDVWFRRQENMSILNAREPPRYKPSNQYLAGQGNVGAVGRQTPPKSAAAMLEAQSVQSGMQPSAPKILDSGSQIEPEFNDTGNLETDELDITHVDYGPHALPPSAGTMPAPPQFRVFERSSNINRLNAEQQNNGQDGPAFKQSAMPNVEFRDASNTVLFDESLSDDYPLEDVFYQYYPTAPRALLFYFSGNIALPKRSTLESIFAQFSVRKLPVIIWTRMPIATNPGHTPQW